TRGRPARRGGGPDEIDIVGAKIAGEQFFEAKEWFPRTPSKKAVSGIFNLLWNWQFSRDAWGKRNGESLFVSLEHNWI
ncbi:MAG: hypothetical protein PUE61_03620, partial [Clostridiales bacterium]|nr:hypothetical protein [Clostridiales bacterium]